MKPATLEEVEIIVSERIAGLERRLAPEALTVRDVAARLRLSVTRVRELIADGALASYKIGSSRRVDPSVLAAFLADRQRPAASVSVSPAAPSSGKTWLQEFQRQAYGE